MTLVLVPYWHDDVIIISEWHPSSLCTLLTNNDVMILSMINI